MVEVRQIHQPAPVAAVVIDEAGQPLRGVAVNASPEVAAYFDRMLDAMCYLESPWSSGGPKP